MKARVLAAAIVLALTESDSAFAVDRDRWSDMAVVYAEDSIKAQLRDPDSFEWADGARGWNIYWGHGVPTVVCANFRARNGFSGYNAESAVVALALAKNGDFDHSPVQFNPSRKSWKQLCKNI